MSTTKHTIQSLLSKVQGCLEEEGIAAEVTSSDHEAILAARVETHGTPVRFVAQITDRDHVVEPAGTGAVDRSVAQAHLSEITSRPSLGQRSASASATLNERSIREVVEEE